MTNTFEKVKIKNRDNEMVKYKKIFYSQPKETSDLQKNFFVALVIGATGSGKTVSMIKNLTYNEKEGYYNKQGQRVPMKTIVICPTFQSNPIYKTLKSLDLENDVYEEYSEQILTDILDGIKKEKKEIERYEKKVQLYNKYLKAKSMKEFDYNETMVLQQMNFYPPVKTSEFDHPPVYHIIFDDLVGTNCYKSVGKSVLNNLAIKGRHKNINCWFLAQSSKQLPKIVRNNSSFILLYKYHSNTMLEDLYENVSGELTPQEFKDLYSEATAEKYNFLTIDCTKKYAEFRQNFDYLFILNNKKKNGNNILTESAVETHKENIEVKTPLGTKVPSCTSV